MKEILAGELIGIIEEECVPGATLPRAEPEERIAATMASHPRSKNFGKVALEQAQSSFPKFLGHGKQAIAAAPFFWFWSSRVAPGTHSSSIIPINLPGFLLFSLLC